MRYITPVASLLIGVALFFIANKKFSNFNPNELGLGINTTSHISRINGTVRSGIEENIDSVLIGIKKTESDGTKKIAIWIGNSQLHAINKYQNGDLLAIDYAQQELYRLGSNKELFQFSSPHLNITEEQIYINTLRTSKITPDYLILPITFRSYHFIKMREELKRLKGYENIAVSINDKSVSEIYKLEASNDQRGKLESKVETWQDKSENLLNNMLSENVPYYKYRDNTKSYVKFLPLLILHEMTEKNKDPKVPGKKDIIDINIASLKEILNYAENNNIKVLLYQVPHPQDDAYFFYDKNAYKEFFSSLEKIVVQYKNVHYIKLEKIVPLDLWGTNNDNNKDTYHFQAQGHKILGDTIAKTLNTF